jgi:hypothetical protein
MNRDDLIKDLARAMRFNRFQRTGRASVFDPDEINENEIDDARVAVTFVMVALDHDDRSDNISALAEIEKLDAEVALLREALSTCRGWFLDYANGYAGGRHADVAHNVDKIKRYRDRAEFCTNALEKTKP